MDNADKDLSKTSDVKREAMVSKLHNMQWLKSTPHSANPSRTRAACKRRMRDYNENIKTEDNKVLFSKTGETRLAEEPDTTEKCKEPASGNVMSDSNKDTWNKENAGVAEVIPNIKELGIREHKGDALSVIEAAKLKAEMSTEEGSKDTNTAEMKTDEITVHKEEIADCPSLDKTLKVGEADGSGDKMNPLKYSDIRNNNTKLTSLETDVAEKAVREATDAENDKTSPQEAKDKDADAKATINVSKSDTKTEGSAASSKSNEKPSSGHSLRKSVSSCSSSSSSRSTPPINKNTKVDRANNNNNNNKHAYARNIACIRREEFVKQRSVSQRDGTENDKRDAAAARSSLSKSDVEAELDNKTIDTTTTTTTHQSRGASKSKPSQKQQQQAANRQSAAKTKPQEFKKGTSNNDKDNTCEKTLEKTESAMTQASSKSCEPSSTEPERKDQKAVDEKNSLQRNDQRANHHNVRRSNTFVTQYRTVSKQQGTGSPSKLDSPASYGRNVSFVRNNPRLNRDRGGDNVGYKGAAQRDYNSNNPRFNRRAEEARTSNTENRAKRQNEADAAPKPRDACTSPAKARTQSADAAESANNTSVDHDAEQKPAATEQPREGAGAIDDSKADVNQQDSTVVNEVIDMKMSTPAHPANGDNDKYTLEAQIDTTSRHLGQSTQWTDSPLQLENSQTWRHVSPAMQRINAPSASSQQSVHGVQHFDMQQQIDAESLTRQVSPWAPDCGRFYEQHFALESQMRLGAVSNAFEPVQYENNLQAASSDSDIGVPPSSTLEMAIDRNRESSNALYKYVPHVHPRTVPSIPNFPGYHAPGHVGSRWSTAVQEGGIHVDQQPSYNVTQPPATMQVYKSGTFGPDDFNAHATNCLPHPVVYTPCMQAWNPQLQYPLPIFYNAPYAGYAILPDPINRPNEFEDAAAVHLGQQPKYVSQAHANSYVRSSTRDYESPGYQGAQPRGIVDNVPAKSTPYYKRYHDNGGAAYDLPRNNVPPPPLQHVSHPRAQQQGMNFMPANVNQRNVGYSQSPKYYRQNNNVQMPKKDQRIQDFVCDDNAQEDIPPMISPKEFITSHMNLPGKSDQFVAQSFKTDFKMSPCADYRPPLWQRYNSNYRRNASPQDFSRENESPVSIGRGTYKNRKP